MVGLPFFLMIAFDISEDWELGWGVLRYPSFSFYVCISTGRIIPDLSKQAILISDETDTTKETPVESCLSKIVNRNRNLVFFLTFSCHSHAHKIKSSGVVVLPVSVRLFFVVADHLRAQRMAVSDAARLDGVL
jgi:hypothetical protein